MFLLAALALSIPLHFEPNRGQAPPQVRYLAPANLYTLALSDTGVAMHFAGGGSLRMNLPRAPLEALDALPGKTNYYLGADPSAWRTNVPNYARVRCRSVFPGVDLVIYGKQQQIEYDWVVAPQADPSSIRFSFAGASRIRVDEGGDLVLDTAAGEVRHRRPYVYQAASGRRREVAGGFVLSRYGEVRFRIGPYDRRQALIIDPQLIHVTGLGGSGIAIYFPVVGAHGTMTDTGTGIALDRDGNTYITGTTFSTNFPLVRSLQPAPTQSCTFECIFRSVFVAKLSARGNTLLYSTYIAAPSQPQSSLRIYPPLPSAIATDADGNAYVTGTTSGVNFPQVGGGSAAPAGGNDAFLIKLDSSGALIASILFGGSGDDTGNSIALGPDGRLYVAGMTQSPNFPASPGAYHTTPFSSQDVFLMKINPAALAGNKPAAGVVLYSTYLGPGDSPVVSADSSGNAYVAASTTSTLWSATPGAVQSQCAGATCADAVVVKINPAGTRLLYTTYLGGSGTETAGGVAVDASGSAYLSGATTSTDFPATSGAFQTQWVPNQQVPQPQTAFVAKLSPDATRLVYATYLHGDVSEGARGIAVDAAGNAYVAGGTSSPAFPILNAIQTSLYNSICTQYTPSGTPYQDYFCGSAGFLSVLKPDGSGLTWSTYLGSGTAYALALDSAGNVYTTGNNISITGAPADSSPSNSAGMVEIAPQGAPLQFSADAITDGASFHRGLPRPGGLASLFLHGISASGIVQPSGFPLPDVLAGVSVFVGGVPAPILAVANIPVENPLGMQQVNFQVPFEAKSNLVEVRYQGLSTFTVPQPLAPGIFTLSDGSGAIQHSSDYSLVTPSNPATKGEVILIYATGLGPVSPAVPTGTAATGPATLQPRCGPPSVSVGDILYAGVTPGFAGLYQLNVRVSPDLPSGSADLYINWSDCWFGAPPQNYYQSNTVKLPVQ